MYQAPGGVSNANQMRHIRDFESTHITVRDSYFFGRHSYDDYGFNCYLCADALVENNIFQNIGTPMNNEAGEGHVFGYNYTINNWWGPDGTWAQGSFYEHAPGTNYFLVEGSDGYGIELENYFGQAHFITAFRNRLWGVQSAETGQGSQANQTVPMLIYGLSRYQNVIGNVLGTSGYHSIYQDVATGTTTSSTSNCVHSVYAIGLGGNCENGDNSGWPFNDPTLTKSTLMRWGNWDVVTNASRWCGNSSNTGWSTTCSSTSEVPTGLSLYANTVPAIESLPSSFYLSSKPSWMGSRPWPAIGPDIAAGT